MQIQLDIPEELNKELKRYKIDYDLKNLQESVLKILSEKFFKTKSFKELK